MQHVRTDERCKQNDAKREIETLKKNQIKIFKVKKTLCNRNKEYL